MTYVEKYNYGVTPIYSFEQNIQKEIATGFFYKDIERGNTPYLITNHHVAIDERARIYNINKCEYSITALRLT
jgi:S1-C subfamily serine protease